MSVNDKQVGGDHYKGNGEYQHWDVVIALNWDYLVGAATKYLWRLGRKGDMKQSIEDIGKAIHYLEKKREVMLAEWGMQPKEEPCMGTMPGVPTKEDIDTIIDDVDVLSMHSTGVCMFQCRGCGHKFGGTVLDAKRHMWDVHKKR